MANPIIDEKRLVPKIDFYGPSAKDPWRTWEDFGGQSLPMGEDLYFFTTLRLNSKSKAKAGSRLKSRASRVSRKAGDDGCWHEEHAAEVTHPMSNKPLGINKSFTIRTANPAKMVAGICLSLVSDCPEYPLAIVDDDEGQLVLCQLRKNEAKLQKNERKRKREFGSDFAAENHDQRRKLESDIHVNDLGMANRAVVTSDPTGPGPALSSLVCVPQPQPQPLTDFHSHVQLDDVVDQPPQDFQSVLSQIDYVEDDGFMADHTACITTDAIQLATQQQMSLPLESAEVAVNEDTEIKFSNFLKLLDDGDDDGLLDVLKRDDRDSFHFDDLQSYMGMDNFATARIGAN